MSCYLLYSTDNGPGMSGDSEMSISTGAVAVITVIVTFIVSVTATAIITFIVTYYCVNKKSEKAHSSTDPSPQEKVLYEQVIPSSNTITKNDVELQPNPAYGTSHKIADNLVYESCK